jgi:hypothetical protein
MKKALIFILLVLFTGLTAFSGQSVNGPGIRDFVPCEDEILAAPATETAISAVPAIGLLGVSPVIEYANSSRIFECTMSAYPDIRKGGVLSFDGGRKPGV